ncbi:MAG: PorP/SprF family type IX secretion system membrane protein [Cytophagaceae bacterium]|nr:PorP/SprF family type IX secretion system membrane protein [Cytophagaceae bacterium]
MIRILVSVALLCSLSIELVRAQQMPQTVNFMYNQLIYNPAAAGMHETDFNANLVTRFQWGGKLGGGPISNMLWADYKFAQKRMAAGLNVNFDKFGATSNLDVLGNYSYYIPLSNKLKLYMGLRAGLSSARLNTADLKAWDPDDVVIAASDVRATYPKVGAGFQLLSKNYYVGFSLPDFFTVDKYNIYGNKDKSLFQKRRNYLFMSGYKWKINDTYDLYPNVRLIYFPGNKIRADFNTIFEITDYFWFGLTYSTSRNHAIMAGTHISSRVRFSYAFEFNAKANVNLPLSTHEINIMLNLDDLF